MGEIPSGGMWKVRTMKMKLARTTSFGITALFALVVLAAISMPAAAQTGSTTVTVTMTAKDLGPEGRLAPEAELANIDVEATVKLSTVGGECVGQMQVKFTSISPPAYASVVLNPAQATEQFATTSVASAPGQTQEQTKIVKTTLQISTTRDAPAFKDDTYRVKADVTFPTTTGGCTMTGNSAEGQVAIKNDYLPLTQVAPGVYFQKSGQNKKVIFPIDVTNLGNGPTRIKVEVTQPNKNKLDSIIPPAELHLESRAQKGPSALFRQPTRIEAQTPHANGYTNSIYSFNVKFISAFDGAGQNTAGDETSVTLSVQVQGVYVPGFDPASMIGALGIALGGVAFFRRRQ